MTALAEVTCLVMAGGRGERMRATRPGAVKPLVPVGGVPLLERAVAALLAAGARRVVVATSAATPEVAAFARGRCAALAEAATARLDVIVELRPLGTIGAVGELRTKEAVLVVNADNLTRLDPQRLWHAHVQSGAAMTVATHAHATRIPFAVIDAADGWVRGYREKPVLQHPVASALYALGGAAVAAVEPGEHLDAPELVQRLLQRGERVAAFAHDEPWIDVNDTAALAVAEAQHSAWPGGPTTLPQPVDVVGCVLTDGDRVLLEWRPPDAACYAGLWDTPGGKIEPGEAAEAAMRREVREELGVELADLQPLAGFDDRDPTTGRWFRHRAFAARALGHPRPHVGQLLAWFDRDSAWTQLPLSQPARIAMAAAGWVNA